MNRFFFRYIARALVWLRYRVTIVGREKLLDLKGPALVVPNHPGLIDPALVMAQIGGEIPLRPLVTSVMYRRWGLYPIMRMINALEVPDLEKFSQAARQQTQGVIDAVVQGLDQNDIFLIYPAGRLERRGGKEALGGSRAVSDILAQRPKTKLVLLRTAGVWGSMSTFAPTGQDPDLEKCFFRAVWTILSNFIFFIPRRPITMTVELADLSALPDFSRETINPFLENWYNQGLSSEPVYVPYHFYFGPRTFTFPQFADAIEVPLDKITPKTQHDVLALLEEKLKRPLTEKEKQPAMPLDGLGLDSLDRMEIALQIEQRFGFRSDAVATNVGQLWALAQGLVKEGQHETIKVAPSWLAPRAKEDQPLLVQGETIPEAFVRMALAHPQEAIAADDLSGVVTYERLLVGARLMARRFAQLPGDSIGVMLPASVAADTVMMALWLAGKLPVILNWTTGPGNLAHAAKTLQLQRVITSQKFQDRLGVEVPGAEFFYLEDFRQSLGKVEMLAMLLRTRFFGAAYLAQIPKRDPQQPAVVLFTSGSEKAPKAVPLSHRNILLDAQAGASALEMKRGDILLGFLPPFHSFGLSGTMVLPLVTGLRVVHHADPTDSAGLVRKIAAYQPTLMLSTPTFFNYVLGAAKPADLTSLRLVVTGAEKCPDSVFDQAKHLVPHALITEGYGIAECSPVVSVSRPGNLRRGTIGQPLDGVELMVVHPETQAPLPVGEMGLLLISGPTVFSGYWQHEGASPFVEIGGKTWYITGDLVRLDAENFIHFAGRQKRFLKAGGEMISLPALEEPLAQLYPVNDQGPQIAVEGIETPEGRRIVGFTTTALTLVEANAQLVEAGFRGIMRLDEVRRVEKIPVLGTGKTDYKVLRAQI